MELYILYGLIIVFIAALARLAQLTGVEMLKEQCKADVEDFKNHSALLLELVDFCIERDLISIGILVYAQKIQSRQKHRATIICGLFIGRARIFSHISEGVA